MIVMSDLLTHPVTTSKMFLHFKNGAQHNGNKKRQQPKLEAEHEKPVSNKAL